jgi:hypothetical protein
LEAFVVEGMRERLARALVRWASRWIEAAYRAYCDDMPRLEALWSRGGRHVQRIAFPLASRLDREAMGEQMAREGWWG